jgi:hypothetical protein
MTEEKKAEEKRATSQGRAVIIKHPKTGQDVRRVDYIREEVLEKGRPKGDVARELGVAYQIVFAACKQKPEKPPEAAKDAPKNDTRDAKSAKDSKAS